ncbi:hypothetical protein [Streptomyces sp. NPDC002044]|uniref:hypothetical protein n=1 Tax=Streptomyces sp. NPDC002044 TaxID=3154662 RepID=UPI003333B259
MNALLKLYPAAYRHTFGDEIADAYREATDGASRPARIREAADVAGHALRMRLGIGSAGRAGRLLAALAPFAVIAVGLNAMHLTRLTLSTLRVTGRIGEIAPAVLTGAGGIAALVGAVLALTGRWTAGTRTVLAGIAASMAVQVFRPGLGIEFALVLSGPTLLLTLTALLCPPDARPVLRLRSAATGVPVALAGAAALALAPSWWPLPHPQGVLYFAVPAAAGLLLAGRRAFARLRTGPAVLLASLPFAVVGVFGGTAETAVLPLAIGLPMAAAVSIRRRRGATASPSA